MIQGTISFAGGTVFSILGCVVLRRPTTNVVGTGPATDTSIFSLFTLHDDDITNLGRYAGFALR